jgi:hypothetical protein
VLAGSRNRISRAGWRISIRHAATGAPRGAATAVRDQPHQETDDHGCLCRHRAAYRLDHLPTQQEVLAIADKWRPYRSLATSYLFSATFAQAKTPPAAQRKT